MKHRTRTTKHNTTAILASAILTSLSACELCRRNGASAADEPGKVAVYCANGAFDCMCVDESEVNQ